MAGPANPGDLDALYQLPLGEFTAARNALAKRSGSAGAEIRGLGKPPVAAWAVNQVYWRRRAVYDALTEAASRARAAHAAALSGKQADLRAATRDHEEALDAALKSALEILREDGQPATDATRQAIATTLRALPSPEPPGRLAKTLQPGGLEMLAGLSVRGAKGSATIARAPTPPSPQPAARTTRPPQARHAGRAARADVDQRALARARQAVVEATRAVRLAEHAASREEFEAARAARGLESARRDLATARDALAHAERTVTDAERDLAAASRAREQADRKARQAGEALDSARARLKTSEEAVQHLMDDAR
ncbi:MAG TPA: hypothetical protein VD833_09810 [Vicinamibacterales bacterium]|nr:hypothetical protein [Vicinamibacterales bacterium]